jgi:hypothetical protein
MSLSFLRSPAAGHPARRAGARAGALAAALALLVAGTVAAQSTAPRNAGSIYTCIDDRGRRLTSDRPIAECIAREQQILNRDGSLRAVVPPTLTAEERHEKEARDRQAALDRAAAADAVRRDRNLMSRYPNEGAHQKAREAALDTVRLAMRATEVRLRDLAAARKPLMNEAEFYEGRQLPPKLKDAIDANDAALEAQRAAAASQEAEVARVNRLYDGELDRLRRLWAGAPAGSLGPLPGAQANGRTAMPATR